MNYHSLGSFRKGNDPPVIFVGLTEPRLCQPSISACSRSCTLLSLVILCIQSQKMPTVPLHLTPTAPIIPPSNPLPQLLETPTGLAILEIQGTVNLPSPDPSTKTTPIGRLVFPDYFENSPLNGTAWMKRVHLYVGQHQRLTGEVKKLPNPIAVIRKREHHQTESEELEIVEVVYWKVIFSSRPEPVGT